jgi:site-specific recombinase XerD
MTILNPSRTSRTIPVDAGVFLYQRRQGGIWHISVAKSGQRERYSLRTWKRDLALQMARQRVEEVASSRNGYLPTRNPFIGDLMKLYEAHSKLRNRESTEKLNFDNLKRVFEYVGRQVRPTRPLRLSDFAPEVVEAYMSERIALGVQISTVNRERSTLHAFFSRASRRRVIRENPISMVDPIPDIRQRIPVTLSADQIEALLEAAAIPVPFHGRGGKGRGHSRDRLTPIHDLALFALNTGARLGEILHLEVLERRRSERGSSRWVFPSQAGGVLERRNVLREFKIVAGKAGIPSANFLILRHTALTALARGGVPPFVLKEIAGHRSIRTTERYYIGHLGGWEWSPPVLGCDAFGVVPPREASESAI